MKRRSFIGFLGAAAAWPLTARAQQATAKRVGVLMGVSENSETRTWISAFRSGLQALRWVEDADVKIEIRWASGDIGLMRSLASELIEWRADVVLTHATPATVALSEKTRTLQNVFVGAGDPVGSGFVENIHRPGRNSTGFTNFELSVGEKWVEILRRIAPQVRRIALLLNPKTYPGGFNGIHVPFIRTAAISFGMETIEQAFDTPADIRGALAALAIDRTAGLIAMPDTSTTTHSDLIAQLAAFHRIPAVYPYPFFVSAGGLLSYGTDFSDLYRRAASYVDRILRGERAAELPVQAPTKYTLVINLMTAKALDLEIPPTLLALADEVIE